MLNPRLGVTLSIMVGVMLVCVSLGLLFGVMSALRGGWIGKAIDVLSLDRTDDAVVPGRAAVHHGVRGLAALAARDRLRDVFARSCCWLASLVLPILSVSFLPIANIAKQTRDGMNDVLRRDFIRALRASGVPERCDHLETRAAQRRVAGHHGARHSS